MDSTCNIMSSSIDALLDRRSIRAQLTKVVSSAPFADSQRMARFLTFVVDETLKGCADQLKENVIGTNVFDRPPAYDTRLDPIVRVEARRLRSKLCAYYERDGRSDALVFELPKGRYSPVIRARGEPQQRTPVLENKIAVLPFVNLSTDADAEYLSDGLTEDLINALTRISHLRVCAWTSSARMKDDQDDLDYVRSLLGVTFVLRGSVRKTKDKIRVLAHLIETSTKQYVWSEVFSREFQDFLAIQDEITKAITGALRTKLTLPEDGDPSSARYSHDAEAHQLCLKGRFHSRERTSEGLQRALLCFEGALQRDKRSVSAHAGLADTLVLQAEYAYVDAAEAMKKAKAAVERALVYNPASAEVQASYGLILSLYEWSWDAAEAAFRLAIEINPNYAPAHHWYGMNHLAMLGRFSEAECELDAAITLDPLSPVVFGGRAYLRLLRREYQEAISIYDEMIALDPSFYKAYTSLGRAFIHSKEYKRAIEMLKKGISLGGEIPTIYGALAQAYGESGDHEAALLVIEKLKAISHVRPVPSTCFALAYLGLRDFDSALLCLERAVLSRETSVLVLAVHPAYDLLRDQPRFKALVDPIFQRATTAILP